jgi:hypothetical protein
MYGIWATVRGGVTGHREAWLKRNGVRAEFATREVAESEARNLNREMNHPHATATYRYTAMPLEDF